MKVSTGEESSFLVFVFKIIKASSMQGQTSSSCCRVSAVAPEREAFLVADAAQVFLLSNPLLIQAG